jgi:predicted ATP-dependent endonuclease of OLD family
MQLKTVRVTDFKSVEDSNEFSVSQVTCLVGKNESGKTALLQAMYKLKPDIDEDGVFLGTEFPRARWSDYEDRSDKTPATAITTAWELDDRDVAAVEQMLGKNVLKSRKVTVSKRYGERHSIWEVDISEQAAAKHLVRAAGLHMEERAELEGKTTAEIAAHLKAAAELSERQAALQTSVSKLRDSRATLGVIDILSGRVPTFVYFADYYTMPGRISVDVLVQREQAGTLDQGQRVFMALLDMVGTTPSNIQHIAKSEELIAKLESVSARLSREIFEYWSQNKHLGVDFRFDAARPGDPAPYNTGYIFNTRVENKRHAVTVPFDERSAGFVWFFSFLVWFSQMKKNYGDNLIILLDEPGLSLHARAQHDLLRYIREKLMPHYQVLYTTHSPFMVDAGDLLTVRTVEDVVNDADVPLGTKVRDDVLSTDPDTLFPLQAALGYDITQTLFVGKHIVLVEGASDLLYLRWASNELRMRGKGQLDPRWVVTPIGGVDKVVSFLALFRATGLNVAVVADYHQGATGKVTSLRASELLKAGHVLTLDNYTSQHEADIEDLLGRDAYRFLLTHTYDLDAKQQLPATPSKDAPERVVKEAEAHMRLLAEAPDFDHFALAAYLVENAASVRSALPGHDQILQRFEKLINDINALLPKAGMRMSGEALSVARK